MRTQPPVRFAIRLLADDVDQQKLQSPVFFRGLLGEKAPVFDGVVTKGGTIAEDADLGASTSSVDKIEDVHGDPGQCLQSVSRLLPCQGASFAYLSALSNAVRDIGDANFFTELLENVELVIVSADESRKLFTAAQCLLL